MPPCPAGRRVFVLRAEDVVAGAAGWLAPEGSGGTEGALGTASTGEEHDGRGRLAMIPNHGDLGP